MRVPRVTVDLMAAIIAVAEKRNLQQAAKELGLTASAVHKRLKVADQIFRSRLFVSTPNGIELTEVGEVFYAHSIKAIEHMLLTEETTAAASEIQARHLLVGHSTYLPARLLALLHDPNIAASLG